MNRNMTRRFAVATCCGKWKEIVKEYGIAVELDQYCQAENMDGERGEKVAKVIKKQLQEFPALALHGPFNELFPAAIDPGAREFAMSRFRQAADRAKEFGVKKMVVHSGWIPFVYFKEWQIPRAAEFWREFMAEQPADFELAIENVLDDEPYMMADLAKEIDDPRVGICYDVGHANIVSNVEQDEWMQVLAPYLKHLHIHNNDGERDYHRGLTDGTLDIQRILDQVLSDCSETTTVTAEILGGKESFDWLREKGYLD